MEHQTGELDYEVVVIPNELQPCLTLPPVNHECSLESHIVKITHIDSPSSFYVMLQTTMDYFKMYSDNLNDFYEKVKSPPAVDCLPIGSYCCAKLNGNWMRAKILVDLGQLRAGMNEEPSPYYQVHLVDNGLVTNSSLPNIRFLENQFTYDPPMVIPCILSDVFPLTHLNEYNWSMDAIETFLDLCTDDLMMAVLWSKKLSSHYEVILERLPNNKEDNDDPTINELMPISGYATSTTLNQLTGDDVLEELQTKMNDISVVTQEDMSVVTQEDTSELDKWNPMVEHQEEREVLLDDVDPERHFLGFKNDDETKICSYIRYNKPCQRGDNCKFLHIQPRDDGLPSGSEQVFSYLKCDPLILKECEMYRAMVVAGSSPSMFYTLFEIDDISGMTVLAELQENLKESYRNEPLKSGQTIPALGEIMVLHNKDGDMKGYYRARVIELSQRELGVLVKVIYIDYGREEWVKECQLRTILECYLYTPAQAIECYLYGVNSKTDKWESKATDYFFDLVDGKYGTVTALSVDYAADRYGIELEFEEDELVNVNTTLVEQGYAENDE